MIIKLDTPENTIQSYFHFSHYANESQIRACFSKDARIIGDLSGHLIEWTISDLVNRILNTQTSSEVISNPFSKVILNLEETAHIAIAKARNVVGNLIFLDTIVLTKENQTWLINNKIFMLENELSR